MIDQATRRLLKDALGHLLAHEELEGSHKPHQLALRKRLDDLTSLPVLGPAPALPTGRELQTLLMLTHGHLHQYVPLGGDIGAETARIKRRLQWAWEDLGA